MSRTHCVSISILPLEDPTGLNVCHQTWRWNVKWICPSLSGVHLTSDKHGGGTGSPPCAVFRQAGVGTGVLRQTFPHHETHIPAIEGGGPKASDITCPYRSKQTH